MLKKVDSADREGPFRAEWESLQKYEVPEWYKDAKFGIFIHWGAYSVPAFGNEWYPRNMYVQGSPEYKHHLAAYGRQDKLGYKDSLPMFKAEHFDPVASAELSPPNTGADPLAPATNRWVQREFKFALDLPAGWSPVLAPSELALLFANGPAHGIWSGR